MADRKVTVSFKDDEGKIIALGNPNFENHWSPRMLEDIIFDIESRVHSYYVEQPDSARVYVEVLYRPTGKHIRTPVGCDPKNDLLNIPGEWGVSSALQKI